MYLQYNREFIKAICYHITVFIAQQFISIYLLIGMPNPLVNFGLIGTSRCIDGAQGEPSKTEKYSE